MVSKAREDLPDPDSPVKTIRALRGRSRLTFLRLCSRAPRMRRRSVALRVLPSSSQWGSANQPSHCKRPPDSDCSRRDAQCGGTRRSETPAEHQEESMADFDRAHVEPGGPPHRYGGGPLAVTKLSVGPFDNNAYLLTDPESGEALLVDAANEAERLLGLLDGVSKTDGRTAFEQAIDSAERHLLSLPGSTRISPGHGDDTEVATELPQLD